MGTTEGQGWECRPTPQPWATSFDLGVRRLRARGHMIERQDGRCELYEVDGKVGVPRIEVSDLIARKGVLFDPPDHRHVQPADPNMWNRAR